MTQGVTEWCRAALDEANGDVNAVYERYDEFREATGSVASGDTFRRRVREAASHAQAGTAQAESIKHSGEDSISIDEDVNSQDVRSEVSYNIRTVDDLVEAADIDTRVWHVCRRQDQDVGREANRILCIAESRSDQSEEDEIPDPGPDLTAEATEGEGEEGEARGSQACAPVHGLAERLLER